MDRRVRKPSAAIVRAGRGRSGQLWLAAVLASCVVGGLGCSAGSGAQAATGGASATEVILKPAGGASGLKPTWSVVTACPPGFQGSAILYALNTDGTIGSSISPVVPHVTAAFSGTVLGSVKKLFALGTDVRPGGTSKWEVACAAGIGSAGKQKITQSIYVTLSADGKSYTSSVTPASGTTSPSS
jgi:hypothetical protein